MSATIIDGKAIAARVRGEVADGVEAFARQTGRRPGLATVLVGEDPASAVYVGGKQRACAEVGMTPFDRRLPADASFERVAAELEGLNGDDAVSGVLLQLPVPEHLDGPALTAMIDARQGRRWADAAQRRVALARTPWIAAVHANGRDGTARAARASGWRALRRSWSGRSNLFGKPMAQLLLAENATVTVCHSRTADLPGVCARADVLIAAVGRPRLIGADFVKPGAVVIDVGMSRLTPEQAGNKSGLVGDVDFDSVAEIAAAITPVPGGVGPMTIALLLRNTLQAARRQAGVEAYVDARRGVWTYSYGAGAQMSFRTMRWGEPLALVGALCVIVSLFLPWYESPSGTLEGWDTFGPAVVLLLAAAASGLWLFLSTLTERSIALPVAAAVWCIPLGLIGLISAIVRLLERPDHATSVCAGGWLALAGVVTILVGAWQSMRDERTAAYEPATPEPRPRP